MPSPAKAVPCLLVSMHHHYSTKISIVQTMATLLEIPTELRDEIIEYIVLTPVYLPEYLTSARLPRLESLPGVRYATFHIHVLPAKYYPVYDLLRTCHLLRNEALKVAKLRYNKNPCIVDIQISDYNAAFATFRTAPIWLENRI